MLRSARFPVIGRRALTGAASAAVLAAAMAAPAMGADGLGYTDVRLTFGTMPLDGFKGGPGYNQQSDDFDSGFRIGVLAIGPICGILPIGCATPPRLSASGSRGSSDTYGGYDDLSLEEDFVYYDSGYSYDLLIGFELSLITLNRDGEINPLAGFYGSAFSNPLQFGLISDGLGAAIPESTFWAFGLGEPEIDFTAVAFTFHFGWGFEIATRTKGRWHWEITPFVGVGLASAEWTDGLSGEKDDGEGFYYELGGRLGTYYTFPMGLQLGGSVRLIHTGSKVTVFGNSLKVGGTGFNIAAEVGWRF